jgi:hypothetical protein
MDEINIMAKELAVECHERGFSIILGIVDPKTHQLIRAADGNLAHILTLMVQQLWQLSEQSGCDVGEMIDEMKLAAVTSQKKKGGKKNGTSRKSNSSK